jgi:YHS domain-containing protein
MKTIKILTAIALTIPFLAGAADEKTEKPKPYPLKTCVVSGEKLGEMGDPYVFTYQGREIKMCCKGCLKDFNKEPAKYIKQLEEAEKSAKK